MSEQMEKEELDHVKVVREIIAELILRTMITSFIFSLIVPFVFGAEDDKVLECDTTSGEHVLLTRDSKFDKFVLHIGNTVSEEKQSNDMGTSYRYSAAEPVSNREVYLTGKNGEVFTIGVNDKGGDSVTAYYDISSNEVTQTSGTCVKNKIKINRFWDDSLFQNMIEIDNQ